MSLDRRFNQRVSAPDFKMKRGAVTRQNGLTVKKVATALFDTAGTDSAGVANTTIASHGTGVYLPNDAVITRAWFEVLTTFTSATDAATLAVTTQTAGDVKAAIAISNVANPWDAGYTEGIQAGAAANFVKLSAEREIVVAVAVEALTAGKMVIFVEYVIGD
jgi:hypothetical protein